jgi:hypothetical protein
MKKRQQTPPFGHPDVLDGLPPEGYTWDIGWIRVDDFHDPWYRRWLLRLRLWWNRKRGKYTITSWDHPDPRQMNEHK